jgi:uncharacterized protein DUF1579
MRKVSTAMAVALCVALGARAQAPEKKPTPSPEQKKLGFFVGTWNQEGEMKGNPAAAGGKISGSETCEWFTGGFQVVCHSSGNGPMGSFKGLGFMTYSADDKAYYFQGIDSMGQADSGKGTLDGKTWTFLSEERVGDKLIHSRYTMTETSPSAYTAKWEMSEDGQSWIPAMEMRATKAEAKK